MMLQVKQLVFLASGDDEARRHKQRRRSDQHVQEHVVTEANGTTQFPDVPPGLEMGNKNKCQPDERNPVHLHGLPVLCDIAELSQDVRHSKPQDDRYHS